MATHSGNRNLCDLILHSIRFDELNGIGLLSPLCVATLQGNIDLMKIYLAMESPSTVQCASESIHGICPLKLAQIMNNVDLIELLQYKHQMHLKIPSDIDMNRTQSWNCNWPHKLKYSLGIFFFDYVTDEISPEK